jgi:uncharacterized cupredoxin-like copper-binding protein
VAAAAVALAAGAGAGVGGCGGGGGGSGGGPAVRLSDYAIAVSGVVKVGHVTLAVHNAGPSAHDVVVLRTDLAADAIPAPGGTADASASGVERLGGTDPILPGGKASVTVDLTPGKYVLVCTLPGHYGQGMRQALTIP